MAALLGGALSDEAASSIRSTTGPFNAQGTAEPIPGAESGIATRLARSVMSAPESAPRQDRPVDAASDPAAARRPSSGPPPASIGVGVTLRPVRETEAADFATPAPEGTAAEADAETPVVASEAPLPASAPRVSDPIAKAADAMAPTSAVAGPSDGPAPPLVAAPAPAAPHAPSAAVQATGAPALVPHPVLQGVALPAVPVEIGLTSLAGINRFDIRLAPDDLGQIDVRLDIDEEGRVRAHLVVERPEAYAHLQRETGQLERALEQAGLKTGDDGVALSLRQQGSGDGGRGDGREGRQQPSPSSPGRDTPDQHQDAARQARPPIRLHAWSHASGIDRRI
ncbi:flagellar hook-length control protein FliK [Enterovirga rhinocerotis]|uniref:Flagellar hook-length control protein FliK n=2 Tax=Enterovirga rhinocerotis TaxID=1339210 RepID=A0A4R7BXZ3_9HYPH|nr:flagellar hook-length control protein FliK [Enterovirga rhinocerotis]